MLRIVSIHAPAWGAIYSRPALILLLVFQFMLPRGEQYIQGLPLFFYWCFNSCSRVGSNIFKACPYSFTGVSIHAPAWGAIYSRPALILLLVFQFMLPRGEQYDLSKEVGISGDVSIHAPAWGAIVYPKLLRVFISVRNNMYQICGLANFRLVKLAIRSFTNLPAWV
ncbi:hypothetical protein DA01_00595 [Dehalococcoides mccartyi]|uniref:Uncharacterized protein n=1 Tax=Dehalococcoides mccartyi TaxID=61435 RepID=A0A0V8M645_9CHLR|nr:hypothetical protein DA01_00595 [Dehalococcoides mccartyi]